MTIEILDKECSLGRIIQLPEKQKDDTKWE
jgi:hypothetical protein